MVVDAPSAAHIWDSGCHHGKITRSSHFLNDIEGAAFANMKCRMSSFAAVIEIQHAAKPGPADDLASRSVGIDGAYRTARLVALISVSAPTRAATGATFPFAPGAKRRMADRVRPVLSTAWPEAQTVPAVSTANAAK